MRAGVRFVRRGMLYVVGVGAVLVAWGCGSARQDAAIPVLEVVMDLSGSEPEFTAEDSTAVQRLENGDGPVRFRMVMCGEVLVDEVVSNREDFDELMERRLLEAFEWVDEWSDGLLAEVEAMDPDSIAAAAAARWEAMTPAERDSIRAAMERLMPIVEALDTISPETLDELMPGLRERQCEQWRELWQKQQAVRTSPYGTTS